MVQTIKPMVVGECNGNNESLTLLDKIIGNRK